MAARTAQRLLELVELQQENPAEASCSPMSQPEDALPAELHLGGYGAFHPRSGSDSA